MVASIKARKSFIRKQETLTKQLQKERTYSYETRQAHIPRRLDIQAAQKIKDT